MTLSAFCLLQTKVLFPFSSTEPYKRNDATTTAHVNKSTSGTDCLPTTLIWSARASLWTGFFSLPPVSACAATRGGGHPTCLHQFAQSVYFVHFHNCTLAFVMHML